MHGQMLRIYCAVLLSIKITCSLVSAKQSHLVSQKLDFENMSLLPIIFAKSIHLPAGICKDDTQKFLHDLLNGSIWAVEMFDASTKYPDGILYGHTRHLGNFDECYNIQVNVAEESGDAREITGKYCLVDIEYEKKDAIAIKQTSSISKYENYISNSFLANNSFWEVVKHLEDFLHVRRNHFQMALCVPASCDVESIETALKIPLEKLGASQNIEIRTNVKSTYCYSAKEAPTFTVGARIYCVVLLTVLSLVIISTWYDCTSSKDENNISIMRNIILHFSARRSYTTISQLNYTHTGLDSIYLIRVIVTIVAIYMHCLLQNVYNPTVNLFLVEKVFKMPLFPILINAAFAINIFFTLSGILSATQLLKHLDRYKELDFFKNVMSRYMRLTPVYATIIGFYIWIMPLIGSGPFWNVLLEQREFCAKNWWMNLLYINTYAAPSELCALHGWYLTADFQLFVCSQFVIYIFWRMPQKMGYTFLGLLTLISSIAPFVIVYIYGFSAVLRFTPYRTSITSVPEFEANYIKTHINFTAYIVGIIVGAIIHNHKGSTWRLSKFWSYLLIFPLPVSISVLTQYWSHTFYMDHTPNSLKEAFFAILQKYAPSLLVCSVILILSFGSQSKFYYHLFTPRWVQPLANISYGVYMVNLTLIMYSIGEARTARTFGFFMKISDTVLIIIYSFLISLPLTICIEVPCRNIVKQLFLKQSVNKKNNVVTKRLTEDGKTKEE